jgi:sigma-E factor negative regulatory protein RseC
MIKFGLIIGKNEKSGMVTIRFDRPEACGNCHACGYGQKNSEVTLPSDRSVGEWVRVELPENRFVQATALVYIIPLVGLLAGLLLGWLLGSGSDLVTVPAAVLGLVVAFVTLYMVDRRVSKNPGWAPRITDVYPDKPSSEDLGCGVT